MFLRDLTADQSLHAAPVAMTKALIEGIGGMDFSQSVLKAMNYVAEFDHCTIFEFHDEGPPSLVGISSWNPNGKLVRSTRAYLSRFHHLEPTRAVMHGRKETLFLRHHTSIDVDNLEFRRTCYEEEAIGERLSIVTSVRPAVWLVVNLFRDSVQDPLTVDCVNMVARHAFLVGIAGRRDSIVRACAASPSQALSIQLAPNLPRLSVREKEVCSYILAGYSHPQIANELKIGLSSVITFRKRAYQKLGVGDSRQLRQVMQGHLLDKVIS